MSALHRLIFAAALGTTLALPASIPAFAADLDVVAAPEVGSNYIAARILGAWADNSRFGLDTAAAVPTDIANAYDDFAIGGAVAFGASFGNGFRAEIELSHIEHDVNAHTITALPATLRGSDAFGTTTVSQGLINAYYDFDLGMFSPYVTGGIGLAHATFENHGVTLAAPTAGLPAGDVLAMDDQDIGYAWQIGLGTSLKITQRVALELGYRYSGVGNMNLVAVDGTETNVDFTSHTVLAGLRVSF